MSSKHTHCYSNYVNHILNNSPTKITYTFPRGDRFSPLKQAVAPVDVVFQRLELSPGKKGQDRSKGQDRYMKQKIVSCKKLLNNYTQQKNQTHQTRYPLTSNSKKQIGRSRSKSQTKQIHPFDKYINNQILRSQQNDNLHRSKSNKALRFEKDIRIPATLKPSQTETSKKKVWEKGESPYKFQRKRIFNQFKQLENINRDRLSFTTLPQSHHNPNDKYLKYSPHYRQYLVQNEEGDFGSKERNKKNKIGSTSKQKRQKRLKTATEALQQMNHPSKHITIQGYYPVGTQINPNGKYVPSTYKNIPAHSFGKSPGRNQKKKSAEAKRFQYTPEKNRTLLPNGAELYPEIGTYYRNLTQKKTAKQLKPIDERFVPFSQFGNVNAFRY